MRLPLKLKLMTLVGFTLIGTVCFYLIYAANLFKQDKEAYVYEAALSAASSVAREIEEQIVYRQKQMQQWSQILDQDKSEKSGQSQKVLSKLLSYDQDVLQFARYNVDFTSRSQAFLQKELLDDPKLGIQYFEFLESALKDKTNKTANDGDWSLFKGPSEIGPAHLVMLYRHDQMIDVMRISLAWVYKLLKNNQAFMMRWLDGDGSLMAQGENVTSGVNQESLMGLLSQNLTGTVREMNNDQGVAMLVALHFGQGAQKARFLVSAEIEKAKAFMAIERLVRQSLYYGVMVLSLGMAIGLFFSRHLTRPVELLTENATKMADGDFEVRNNIQSRDEIGLLAKTFNFMAQEIRRYMEQMKEKLRLENELAVAKLVQSTFFPSDFGQYGQWNLAAYNQPATECGGDWWGAFEWKDHLVVAMADATGHGVPAALITASAHSAFYSMQTLADLDARFASDASVVMEMMNKAICKAGDKIQMTCFVAIISKTQEGLSLSYSNASHNPPLLFKRQEVPEGPNAQKDNFHPLMDVNGSRLGQDIHSKYEQKRLTLSAQDALVLYTDGVIDCQELQTDQPEGEARVFGQRRLVKSISESIMAGPVASRDHLAKVIEEFSGGQTPNDDITFVFLGQSV